MAKFPQVDFKVTWRPFQLDSNAPKQGVNKLQMYNEKFGAARIASMLPRMNQVFDNIGLKYSMGGMTGNTFNSHRLVRWAESVSLEKQDALMEVLFKNYFCEEKFLNDREVLLAAVRTAGLDEAEGARILDNEDLWAKEVNDDKTKFGRGVNGVPHFIFQGKFAISGGQPPEAFEECIEELLG